MTFLDDLVLTALRENMFTPERLTELLSTIGARRQERTAAAYCRLASLKSQVLDAEDRLKRLYRGIEEGIVESCYYRFSERPPLLRFPHPHFQLM